MRYCIDRNVRQLIKWSLTVALYCVKLGVMFCYLVKITDHKQTSSYLNRKSINQIMFSKFSVKLGT